MSPDRSRTFDDPVPSQPPAPVPNAAEDGQRNRLKRNRLLATSLLGFMAVVFLGTHLVPDPGLAVQLLRAAAEAGIVGGLADWFAVTALFRHPLGLPIPHTAIIPTSKERIGQSLGRFLERHFLTEEVMLRKLRSAHVAQRFSDWLAAPTTAPVLAEAVVSALPYVIRTLDNKDLQDFARRSLGKQVRQADVAPVLGRAIDILTASGETDVLFERALGAAAQWLEENREQIFQLVRERSRWWIPRTIDRRIAEAIVSGVADLLNKLREPDSEVRLKFREALCRLIDDLNHSPEQREQVNAIKNRVLEHPEVQAWVAAVWNGTARMMLEDVSRPNSKARLAVEKLCLLVGRALASDQAMLTHIDSLLEKLTVYVVSWRHEIGAFVAEVVRSWDTPTLVDRLELVVGSDLQYIRMNGTIVGAFAGCLIFLISQSFG